MQIKRKSKIHSVNPCRKFWGEKNLTIWDPLLLFETNKNLLPQEGLRASYYNAYQRALCWNSCYFSPEVTSGMRHLFYLLFGLRQWEHYLKKPCMHPNRSWHHLGGWCYCQGWSPWKWDIRCGMSWWCWSNNGGWWRRWCHTLLRLVNFI